MVTSPPPLPPCLRLVLTEALASASGCPVVIPVVSSHPVQFVQGFQGLYCVAAVVVVASVWFLCESWAPSPPPWDVSLIRCQTRIIRRRLASKEWIWNTFSIDSTNFRVTFQAFPHSGTELKEAKVVFFMSLVIFASVEKNQME